tara:strand:+ start:2059 stop:3264 length:1206 start_codon:yes stop_codon:yes gene_type:complete
MRSNYKRIGDFIEFVDERNKDLSVTKLLGLSITKEFIPSVANTIGTDMANYKIIKKNQFACSMMQVRRDKKMPVALLRDFDEAIISQAYPVFKILNEAELLPEYLMMWFSRSEFDRHACFLAVGGVRGSLEWDDFLDMELPVPSIEKQRAIVKEYNTIVNRIKLNEDINKKLEKTAKAIYKQWFVDFNFPNNDGKPYKSSGGMMIYNDELGEIPKGWETATINDIAEKISEKYRKDEDWSQEKLIDLSRMPSNSISLNSYGKGEELSSSVCKFKKYDFLFGSIRPYFYKAGICPFDGVSNTSIFILRSINDYDREFIYFHCSSKKIFEKSVQYSNGTKMPIIKWDDFTKFTYPLPSKIVRKSFSIIVKPLIKKIIKNNEEEKILFDLKEVFLAKMSISKSF